MGVDIHAQEVTTKYASAVHKLVFKIVIVVTETINILLLNYIDN